jgi:hypothetical protein
VNDASTVWMTKKVKKPLEMGGVGNQYTTRVEMSAKRKRGQKAQSHGRRGLSPLDHRAASHPPKIWKGKSTRTAIARSSRPKPFSTNLSEVTASLAWKPTFAKICMMMSDCMSVLAESVQYKRGMERPKLRFSLQISHIVI